jgi:hypothetical protein
LSEDAYLLALERSDGLDMLARASVESPMAAYRDLVHFFELAFSMPFATLSKKLVQMLSRCVPELAYSVDEVKRWSSFRNGAVHADLGRTSRITAAADVAPLLPRMLQAAAIVLVNKAEWGVRSSNIRRKWRPAAAYGSPDGSVLDIVGTAFGTARAAITVDAMGDFFGAFELTNMAYTPQEPPSWVMLPTRFERTSLPVTPRKTLDDFRE